MFNNVLLEKKQILRILFFFKFAEKKICEHFGFNSNNSSENVIRINTNKAPDISGERHTSLE